MSKPSVAATVYKLALAGEQAGFSLEEMIELLESGVEVPTLLRLIELRLNSQRWRELPAETTPSQWVI